MIGKQAVARALKYSFPRFFGVAVAGLLLDACITLFLRGMLSLSLPLSGGIGFGIAALFVFWCHERWTFLNLRQSSGSCSRRFIGYSITLIATFMVRIFILGFASPLSEHNYQIEMLIWLVAVGLSFIVNYLLSRFVVFQRIYQ